MLVLEEKARAVNLNTGTGKASLSPRAWAWEGSAGIPGAKIISIMQVVGRLWGSCESKTTLHPVRCEGKLH